MHDTVCLQADALIVDLYMGTANEAAGFRWTVGGFWGAVTDGNNGIGGVAFNFTKLDQLAKGLHEAKVLFALFSLAKTSRCNAIASVCMTRIPFNQQSALA